jgi:uncharacterized protein YbaP (TraB family)
MLDPMKPWLASMTLQAMQYQSAATTRTRGPRACCPRWRARARTRISSFETVEQQMRFLAGMNPQQESAELPRERSTSSRRARRWSRRWRPKWASGDAEGLWKLAGEEFKREQPAGYDVLITHANKAWADRSRPS